MDISFSILEEQMRFEVFKANMAKVKILQETEQGTAIYGATMFADLTGDIFIALQLRNNSCGFTH